MESEKDGGAGEDISLQVANENVVYMAGIGVGIGIGVIVVGTGVVAGGIYAVVGIDIAATAVAGSR